jgi:hypothetical protein
MKGQNRFSAVGTLADTNGTFLFSTEEERADYFCSCGFPVYIFVSRTSAIEVLISAEVETRSQEGLLYFTSLDIKIVDVILKMI